MEIWQDKQKRKGLIATIVVHIAMLIAFIFLGLGYMEPKPEEGIAINLGFMDFGMNINPEPAQSNTAEVAPPPTESTPPPVETPTEEIAEEVVTQEQVETVNINNKEDTPKEEEPKKEDPKKEETEKPVESPTKEEVKPVEAEVKETVKPEPPKPDTKVNNALNNLFDNQGTQSAGDDKEEGIKGKANGKPNSPNFSNPDGLGSQGEGYYLNGRKNINAPKRYPCQSQGKVVVQIWVTPEGKTTRAEPGKRGSTTTDECLLKIAKESAMETKWSADIHVSDLQVGYIVFVYSQN
jgi:protein TonB